MRIIFSLTLCALATFVHAQAQHIGIDWAVKTLLEKSGNLKKLQNNILIAHVGNYIGFAGGLPSVQATINNNGQLSSIKQEYSNHANDVSKSNVPTNIWSSNITGSILLANHSIVKNNIKSLALIEDIAQLSLLSAKQQAIAGVLTSYYNVIRQQAYMGTIDKSLAASSKRVEIVGARRKAGYANEADVLQSMIDYNGLLQSKEAQQLVIDQAKTDFFNLLYIPYNPLATFDDSFPKAANISLDTLENKIKGNPEVQYFQKQMENNLTQVKITEASRYPTLKAQTGFNFNNTKTNAGLTLLNQSLGPFVGLSFNYPIYSGGTVKKTQAIQEIVAKNAQQDKENTEINLANALQKNYLALQSNLSQLKSEKENLDLAEKLLNLTLLKLSLGEATILDVKQAQLSFENESYRLVNLQYNAKAAEIGIKLVTGYWGK